MSTQHEPSAGEQVQFDAVLADELEYIRHRRGSDSAPQASDEAWSAVVMPPEGTGPANAAAGKTTMAPPSAGGAPPDELKRERTQQSKALSMNLAGLAFSG